VYAIEILPNQHSFIDLYLHVSWWEVNMNRLTSVGLLSLIAVVQVLTLVGGFMAYQQMSETTSGLERMYVELYRETHEADLWVTFGLTPDPFAPLIPLVLLGLFLTVVLLVDQVRH